MDKKDKEIERLKREKEALIKFVNNNFKWPQPRPKPIEWEPQKIEALEELLINHDFIFEGKEYNNLKCLFKPYFKKLKFNADRWPKFFEENEELKIRWIEMYCNGYIQNDEDEVRTIWLGSPTELVVLFTELDLRYNWRHTSLYKTLSYYFMEYTEIDRGGYNKTQIKKTLDALMNIDNFKYLRDLANQQKGIENYPSINQLLKELKEKIE